jgi:hypothetical protein
MKQTGSWKVAKNIVIASKNNGNLSHGTNLALYRFSSELFVRINIFVCRVAAPSVCESKQRHLSHCMLMQKIGEQTAFVSYSS